MHTIRKTGSKWAVVFETEQQYNVLCWVGQPYFAAAVASWLNGGERPSLPSDIEWNE
jgi:hypothetical protein